MRIGYERLACVCQTSKGGHFTDPPYRLLRDADALEDIAIGDVGLACFGSDFLDEQELESVTVIDSFTPKVITPARFVLAGLSSRCNELPTKLAIGEPLTVATSYPRQLARFATKNCLALTVTRMRGGSVEGYASTDTVDLIFDISQSGQSLKDNSLVIYREGESISLNIVSRLTRRQPFSISDINDAIVETLGERIKNPTSSLMSQMLLDKNRMIKKFGEECAEVIAEYAKPTINRCQLLNELADVSIAKLAIATCAGISMQEIYEELLRRNKNR